MLATDVFAARINYSAKFTDQNGVVHRTQKLGSIDDDKADLVVNNMGTWSDNKYSATLSRHNMVMVVNAVAAGSKGEASQEVQDMQSLVNQNTQEGE